jgi:hypothetical protein
MIAYKCIKHNMFLNIIHANGMSKLLVTSIGDMLAWQSKARIELNAI